MTAFTSGIARVPNLLSSQIALTRIQQTNVDVFRSQTQLATGRDLLAPSDDPVRAATIATLDDRIGRVEQRLQNLAHADASLSTLDTALGEANDLVLYAKRIASEEINFGSTPDERAAQAEVVETILQGLFDVANREGTSGFVFAGSRPGAAPVESFLGGYRYVSDGAGILTDIGLSGQVPVTIGASNAIGAVSGRVQGDIDLQPLLTPDTRLRDTSGARGTPITLGVIEFSYDGGDRVEIDLRDADTFQDLADTIQHAIRDYEDAEEITILGPNGVRVGDEALELDVDGDGDLVFHDIETGITAQDIGLAADADMPFSTTENIAVPVSPKLTWTTPIEALGTLTAPLGSIRISNLGRTEVVDLSQAETVQDVRNLIEGTGLGVRVEINATGTGLNVHNEVAAGRDQAMSISEVEGGTTATRLGIRTMKATTPLSVFNDGRGVEFVTGNSDPTYDIDFQVVLGDANSTTLTVDLRPQDMTNVGTLIGRINAEARVQLQAAGLPTDSFRASLSTTTNGIVFTQADGFPDAVRVEPRNNSPALEHLGFLEATVLEGGASLMSADRAGVRVNNVFTQMIDLRDALAGNDTFGMTLAAEALEEATPRLAQARALTGGFARRVSEESAREEDRMVLDESIRSQLRDADYAEVATRFTLLQTQLQAGLQAAASVGQRSLLDFLG